MDAFVVTVWEKIPLPGRKPIILVFHELIF